MLHGLTAGIVGGTGGLKFKGSIHEKRYYAQAKPEAIAIDLARTAMIVVDMQNDFESKGGMLENRHRSHLGGPTRCTND
jgi:hypothetical protein